MSRGVFRVRSQTPERRGRTIVQHGAMFTTGATVTRYVDADATAGGDGCSIGVVSGGSIVNDAQTHRPYSSLTAWEAARQGVLTQIEECICCSNHSNHTADTSPVAIDGSTTSATCYQDIKTDAASRPSGAWDDTKYRLYINGGAATFSVDLADNYTRVTGLQVHVHTYAAVAVALRAGGIRVSQNIIRCTEVNAGGYSGLAFVSEGIGIGNYVWDNFVYDFDTGFNLSAEDQVSLVFNNTVRDCTSGIFASSQADGNIILKNNLVQGCTTDYTGTYHAESTNNCDEDGTAPATNRVTGTVTFAAADDCRLGAADAVARAAGADLTRDSRMPLVLDILGHYRRYTWDIGAHQYDGTATAVLTRYVDPDSVGTGDGTTAALSGAHSAYHSLVDWEAARQADLTILGCVEECICGSNDANHTADSTSFVIAGWTTSAGYYIDIKADAGSRAGTAWSDSKYRAVNTGYGFHSIQEEFVRVTGVQFKQTYVHSGIRFFWLNDTVAGSPADIRFDSCFFLDTGVNSTSIDAWGIDCLRLAGQVTRIWNCIFHYASAVDPSNGAVIYANLNNGTATLYAYNNTIIGGRGGISAWGDQGTIVARNNLVQGTVSDCFAVSATNRTLTHNCSDDATSDDDGATDYRDGTVTFAGASDFALSVSDTVAKGYGVDLTRDATLPFVHDILGLYRRYGWDIGASQSDGSASAIVTRYVDPDSAASGDGTTNALSGGHHAYSSLNAWESARQGDLTILGCVEECICESNDASHTEDTAACQISGSTCTASCYFDIKTSAAARHHGVWSTSHHRIDRPVGYALLIGAPYTRVMGLQIRNDTAGGGYRHGVIVQADGCVLDSCIVLGTGTAQSGCYGIQDDADQSTKVAIVRNCIVYGFYHSTWWYSGSTAYLYNCSFTAGYNGITSNGTAVVTAVNCYVGGQSNLEYTASGTLTRTTCAHASATVYSGSTASVAYSTANFTNVTAGSEDLSLVAGASDALKTGGTDQTRATNPFVKDLAGLYRRYGWGIGASQYGGDADAIVTRFVDPDSAAAGDGTTNALSGGHHAYPSLSAWETARQADLTVLGCVEECICGSNDAEHTADASTTISGWTATASCYPDIKTASASRHAGVWSASKYRIDTAVEWNDGLYVQVPFTRVTGLQLTTNHASNRGRALAFLTGVAPADDDCRVDQCLMWRSGSASSSAALHCQGGKTTVRNSVIYGASSKGLYTDYASLGCTVVLQNCSVGGNTSYGVHKAGGVTVLCTNVYSGGNGADDYYGSPTLTTCASEDETGSVGLTGIAYSTATFTNVTASSEDFHLVSGSALREVGTDLSATFTTDIDGETRPTGAGTWDIGADQYIEEEGGGVDGLDSMAVLCDEAPWAMVLVTAVE